MVRFFFDFSDDGRAMRDVDGHDCESADTARLEVLRALPEVLLHDPRDADEREVTCSVRDERGTVLYRASVTLKGQRSPNG